MNIFVDTETTGMPKKGADWRTDYNEFPYILSAAIKTEKTSDQDEIQIEWAIMEWFVKNEGIEITPEITKINGITQDEINQQGKDVKIVLKELIKWCSLSDKIIAHNCYFDSSIIKANVLRYFGADSEESKLIEEALHKDKRIDTVRLAQKKYGGKYISLSDLYFKLFGERFNAHNALEDVIALERVYNELIK